MPFVGEVAGVKLYIHIEFGTRHHTPHLHADGAEFDLDGNFMNGKIDRAKRKEIERWIRMHREELIEIWDSLRPKK